MRIYLYIGSQQADLSSQSLVQFTYTREDLNNPSVVKNSYSQKVTLPGTAQNNKIFNAFFRLDRTTAAGTFNPLKRQPFEIRNERSEIIESGYMKLESVATKGEAIYEYTITLYGGLGGFFYGLTYKSSGDKRTLADMTYYTGNDDTPYYDADSEYEFDGIAIQTNWLHLADGRNRNEGRCLSFVPAYNGIPDGFDADKFYWMYTSLSNLPNLPHSKTVDGVVWSAKNTNGGILIKTDNKHTEWETQDLRCYLQRPALRLCGFLESLTHSDNSGDYAFVLDSSITGSSIYEKLFITLPMLKWKEIDFSSFTWGNFFQGTCSPAELLVALAKVMGWVFRYDKTSKTITLMKRDAFYGGINAQKIDLSDRIDYSKDVTTSPYILGSHYYDYGLDTFGELCDQYESKYGRRYGSQRVNTGSEFDSEITEAFSGVPIKGAAQVLESSEYFGYWGGELSSGQYKNNLFKFALAEGSKITLYSHVGTDVKSQEFSPEPFDLVPFAYNPTYTGCDFMSKPQLHGADNKAEDGSMVLLTFEGAVATPSSQTGSCKFFLSEDCDEMIELTGGKPCWYAAPYIGYTHDLSQLPQFSRWQKANGVMVGSLEFGNPAEIYDKSITFVQNVDLYTKRFKSYAQDRLNLDTKVVTCYVDLRGLEVGESLLQKFFYFKGCWWVLNKISNYSLTTEGTTLCEFIRVHDIAAYTTAQS